MDEEKAHVNTIILWEDQKKRVCDFYACSDGDDKQYPDCEMKSGGRKRACPLNEMLRLLDILNEEQS